MYRAYVPPTSFLLVSYPPAATLPSPRAVAAAAATAAYFLFGPCSILPFHPLFLVLVFVSHGLTSLLPIP